MSDSSDSSCDDTILYLEDVDSEIGECYADPEPLTGPQPYMHEPDTVKTTLVSLLLVKGFVNLYIFLFYV